MYKQETNPTLIEKVFNYPNPFINTDGTKIRYTLTREVSSAKYIVFNASGKVVFYSNDLETGMGTHEFAWNGSYLDRGYSLAPGVYFGFLEINNDSGSRISHKIAIKDHSP